MSADEIITRLGLEPHPEGGWYRETYRHRAGDGGRGALTTIYYLLKEDERSGWHRVTDADEVWTWHAGAPLSLSIAIGETVTERVALGSDLAAGQRPQAVVPRGAWQSAAPEGGWALVGCVVAPAFEFAGFELASPGWEPNGWEPKR